MRMKIVYTHTARQDLREIYEYIAYTLLVPETARSLTDKIMSEVRSLEEFPDQMVTIAPRHCGGELC